MTEIAIYAGGCFWGIQHFFDECPGVVETEVGYAGGLLENPNYQQVCAGNSGHFEVVKVEFDPDVISYKNLTKYFFEIHDPTQANGQGNDIGEQYLSAIFYQNDEQKNQAIDLINELKNRGFDVVTELIPAMKFWPAEEHHQSYYAKNGETPQCHKKVERFID